VLFYGVPAALFMLVGSWWLLRKSLAPVIALTRAAERIHVHNLRERLPRTGNGDELDRLTEVFNSMITRLDESFVHIREFTLHASHELKTPLTVMRSEIETALRDPATAPAQGEIFAGQLDEIARLTMIVDSPMNGTEVPALIGGKPSGETMAITRVDEHHYRGVVKMGGPTFGGSTGTASADGKTPTVESVSHTRVPSSPAD